MTQSQSQSSEPEHTPPATRGATPLSLAARVLLFLMIAAVYVLHQDFWNWRKADPLVFGFLPIGLAYQAAYSILASAMMAVLVACAWPKQLEEQDPPGK
ncbi:MAG TPA: DUF3311 domain-containing protein [Candidatus Baltobacteraceae bacterium]|jgi:hypothetical protein|nr:DUF3311 domain-containing protein [Candidatus Baltobacteraceae bacterium]